MINSVQKISPADLKAQLEEIWNKPGVIAGGNGVAWILNDDGIHFHSRGGKSYGYYLTKEQKERRKGLATYNQALKASVMAQAQQTIDENGLVHLDFRTAPMAVSEPVIAKPVKQARKPRTVKTKQEPVETVKPNADPVIVHITKDKIETIKPVEPEPVQDVDLSYIYQGAKGRKDDLPKRPIFSLANAKASAPNYLTLALFGAFLADIILKSF